jgi:L,D-transpeptidase catalytic domain
LVQAQVGFETRMTSRLFASKRTRRWLQAACVASAGLAGLLAVQGPAGAASSRSVRATEAIESRAAGEPVLAIVSLRSQRITVYDHQGWIRRAPVSSGQKGRETPAGVFSILQKNAEHWSNLYADGYMPHMQRLTWSGIALHGGALPGYPASHGCVRLPFELASRLFDETRMAMRVILSPGDTEPVAITHPVLFTSRPETAAKAAALTAAAEAAARTADQARLAAVGATQAAARAAVPVRVAENLKRRAQEDFSAAEAALATVTTADVREQAERAKAEALARIAEQESKWAAAKAALQPMQDAVAPARAAAVAAEQERLAAAEAARALAGDLEPVSVFVSRASQRVYVRRPFQPMIEAPVTIEDPDRPIGTHVFTAMERAAGADLRWSVVSLQGGAAPAGTTGQATRADSTPTGTDAAAAKAALDRIVLPPEVLEQIGEMASPRSALIVSDEPLSHETGKDTEFVVILSGEPQGSMKVRRRPTARL